MSDAPQGPGWWLASDGKYYPPEQATPPAPPTAPPLPPATAYPMGYAAAVGPPPAKGMSGCLKAFLIGLAVLFVLGIGSCVVLVVVADDVVEEVGDDLTRQQADEADDVAEPECEVNEAGFMTASLSVVNDSSERSNYVIEVAFEDARDAQLDTAVATLSAVDPGQSATVEASTATGPPAGDFTCRVVRVERFSDEN